MIIAMIVFFVIILISMAMAPRYVERDDTNDSRAIHVKVTKDNKKY